MRVLLFVYLKSMCVSVCAWVCWIYLKVSSRTQATRGCHRCCCSPSPATQWEAGNTPWVAGRSFWARRWSWPSPRARVCWSQASSRHCVWGQVRGGQRKWGDGETNTVFRLFYQLLDTDYCINFNLSIFKTCHFILTWHYFSFWG